MQPALQTTKPLNQLNINPAINARTVDHTDVADVKAIIKAKGFIGTLWVRPQGDIIDGQRRFLALMELVDDRVFSPDVEIPVSIMDVSDDEALELSLASVEVRRDLTPADQAQTFYKLKLSGLSEADIAAHFAVSEKLVRQRIGLGSLSPVILAALREGDISIQMAQSFTLGKTHEQQEAVFNQLSTDHRLYNSAVVEAFTQGHMNDDDPKVLFVGEQAYVAAGGTLITDLFQESVSFEDAALVEKLFEEKLQTTAHALKAEGWAFVDILRGKDVNKTNQWTSLPPKGRRQLTDEEMAQLTNAKIRFEELIQLQDGDEGLTDEQSDEAFKLETLIEDLETQPFTAKQIKKCGCAILVHEYSPVEIKKGLLKQAAVDEATEPGPSSSPDLEAHSSPAVMIDAVDYSDSVSQMMIETAQSATKLAMLGKPMLAYRMGLAARLLASAQRGHEAPFKGAHHQTLSGPAFEIIRLHFEVAKTASFPDLLAMLELLEPADLIEMEALLAADQLHFTNLKSADVQTVITLIDPDMTAEGFKADEAFLGKLSRAQIDVILHEIAPTMEKVKGKKSDVTAVAAPLIAQHGWLPQPLRTPSYQGPGSAHWQEVIASTLIAESQQATPEQQEAA